MSRRVFDVGLDMGRIRNGLTPNREGRRSKSIHSAQSPLVVDGRPSEEGDKAVVPRLKQRQSNPDMVPRSNEQQHPDDTAGLSSTPAPESDIPANPSHRYAFEQLAGNPPLLLSQSKSNSDNPSDPPEHDLTRQQSQNALNFDLKPPPPNSKVKHIDSLCERLFSGDHLRVILKDPAFFLRFTAFLNRYKPKAAPLLVNYLDAQKALKAVEYANAVAESIKPPSSDRKPSTPSKAASIDPQFEANVKASFDSLVVETLPAYVTTALTKVVTETMVREITGQGMPYMRDLVDGLAEVFCLADPSLKDCPIVYASEEFYRTTRYARDDVLGRNCRFLQGPKTDRNAISRLAAAIKSGQESCETVLNYRRDGSAFVNLLLTAPLYDNRGIVRYFLGAQIDVSGLVDDGRGLDSLETLLKGPKNPGSNEDVDNEGGDVPLQKHLRALNDLSQLLSVDETNLLRSSSRPGSVAENGSGMNASSRPGTSGREAGAKRTRRVLGEEEEDTPTFESSKSTAWQLSSSLASGGRLPGVYQNYLLVRPHPNLRVIFVSPALRIPGLLQSSFLSHIGGPAKVRDGVADAFEQGAAVTARVTWLPRGAEEQGASAPSVNGDSRPSTREQPRQSMESVRLSNANETRIRYISCTPLLGSDDQVGVWMVIMVENELVTGGLASRERALARYNAQYPDLAYDHDPSMSLNDDGESGKGNGDSSKGKRESLYADYIRKAAATGQTEAKAKAPTDDGTEGSKINGEGRIEVIFTPAEEKDKAF